MKRVKVKIRKHTDAVIPEYMTKGSSGADLCSNEDMVINPSETKLISTGIFLEIPDGYECQVRPRSGLALKKEIIILNSPGTIDSDYRGEIKIIMHNISENAFKIKKGDRIAQIVLTPVVQAEFIEESLNKTERNEGGFGHTGGNT